MPNISSPHLNAVLWSVGLAVLAYLALVIFWKRRSLSIDTVLHGIDQISVAVGKTGAWAIVILTFAMCYEVFSRYLLQAPTEWAFDMSYILYGVLFMLAGPYALSRNGHVRGDFLYRQWPVRRQAALDLVLYFLFFFPGILALCYAGYGFAAFSWMIGEHSSKLAERAAALPFQIADPRCRRPDGAAGLRGSRPCFSRAQDGRMATAPP